MNLYLFLINVKETYEDMKPTLPALYPYLLTFYRRQRQHFRGYIKTGEFLLEFKYFLILYYNRI
jgi:hypothetical protein